MKANVGSIDRVVRVIAGIGLLSLMFCSKAARAGSA